MAAITYLLVRRWQQWDKMEPDKYSGVRGVELSYKRAVDGFVGMLPEGIPCLQYEAVAYQLRMLFKMSLKVGKQLGNHSSPYLTDAHTQDTAPQLLRACLLLLGTTFSSSLRSILPASYWKRHFRR